MSKEYDITTILIDYEKQSIHADQRMPSTGHKPLGFSFGTSIISNTQTTTYTEDYKKIIEISDEVYVVGAGNCDIVNKAIHQLKENDCLSDPTMTGEVLLVVSKKGKGLQINKYEAVKVPLKWWQTDYRFKWEHTYYHKTSGCYSIGSGSEYAEGAFQVSNCGIKAIVAASYLDEYTNDNVQSVYLNVDNSEN